MKRLAKTFQLLETAAPDVFRTAAVGVRFQNEFLTHYHNCGEHSLFDLASLTKVLATTTIMAKAHEHSMLALEQSVQNYFPTFPNPNVQLRHLLAHVGGLPAWLPLHESFHQKDSQQWLTAAQARQAFEEKILASYDGKSFQEKSIYSDLDYMLLGWILEKTYHQSLDAIFQSQILQPTEIKNLQFLPASPDVVPTEDCPWRGHILRGEVHDDNAYVLGGVAGHAGLFGSVNAVLELASYWLKALQNNMSDYDNQKSFIHPETAKLFWQPQTALGSTFALGWDTISPTGSAAGTHFSSRTRGHLGFTGTSVWIDPEKDIIVTLLTNRVFPSRKNEKIKSFRPVFHDTLMLELGL